LHGPQQACLDLIVPRQPAAWQAIDRERTEQNMRNRYVVRRLKMTRANQAVSRMTRRKITIGAAALPFLGLLASSRSADAQGKYPTRSPRLVLPFAAGGVADVTARIVAEKLGDVLGHRFVVDNQPGAGGINAANTVRSARPDGYTLALLSNGTAISVSLFKNLPFDPVKDFAPVSSMGYFDFLFCVNASSPFQSMADFVKSAREKPGTLNIGTINIGSSQNLTAELLKSTAGIDVTLVPYRGSPEVLIALMRDDIQLAVDSYAALKSPLQRQEDSADRDLGRQAIGDSARCATG
jgi:tripartite-type tricarboxylate transporter receptor subunit TctC